MSEPIFFTNEQEWKERRRGLFTASQIHRLCVDGERPMTEEELAARPSKGTGSKTTRVKCETILSEGALTYIEELIAEVEAEPEPEFYTADMQWGKDNEPLAVKRFCEEMDINFNSPRFMYAGGSDPVFYMLSTIAGASPDCIWTEAGAEIKCPKSKTHLKHLKLKDHNDLRDNHFDYWCQCQFNMVAAKKEKWYFVSFDPRYKRRSLQIKIIEVPADVEYQAYMVRRVMLAAEKKNEDLVIIYNVAA